MKRSERHTKEELIADGWIYVSDYGTGCEIWSKGRKRLLWNTRNNVVEFTYDYLQESIIKGAEKQLKEVL